MRSLCRRYAFVRFASADSVPLAIEELNGRSFRGATLRCVYNVGLSVCLSDHLPVEWPEHAITRVKVRYGALCSELVSRGCCVAVDRSFVNLPCLTCRRRRFV